MLLAEKIEKKLKITNNVFQPADGDVLKLTSFSVIAKWSNMHVFGSNLLIMRFNVSHPLLVTISPSARSCIPTSVIRWSTLHTLPPFNESPLRWLVVRFAKYASYPNKPFARRCSWVRSAKPLTYPNKAFMWHPSSVKQTAWPWLFGVRCIAPRLRPQSSQH